MRNIDLYIVFGANNYDENINYPIIDDKLKQGYIAHIHYTLIKNRLNINYKLTERKNIDLCVIPEEYNELLKKFK